MDIFTIISSIAKYLIILVLYGFIINISAGLFKSIKHEKIKDAILILGTSEGEREINLKHVFTIGRNSDNDYVIKDQTISKYHLKIIYKKDHYYITDLNSKNGTFLNDIKIQEEILKDGDVIEIGSTKMKYKEITND